MGAIAALLVGGSVVAVIAGGYLKFQESRSARTSKTRSDS